MTKLKLLSSVAVAALLAMPAFAQTGTSPSTSPSANRPAATSPSGAPATRATLPSDIGSMKVSELVGKNVYTANDEKIGDVNDVVTSKTGGEALAVIGVGGFLGIGEKEAAIPIGQLKVEGDKIVAAGATKDSLKQHADYKKDNYTKVDRDRMVGQAGTGTTGSTTSPSTSGAAGSSTSPSGAPATGGSTGTSGSSTMGGAPTPPASGSMGSGSGTTGSDSSSSPSGSSTQTPKQ